MKQPDIPAELLSPKDSVKHGLCSMIRSRELKCGDRIPAEQRLADHYQVARGTVRAALAELEVEGWLKTVGRSRVVDGVRLRQMQNLSQTVVILSEPLDDEVIVPGYMHAIDAGVILAAHKRGLSCVTLEPDRLYESDQVEKLIKARPLGIVAFSDTHRLEVHMNVLNRLRCAGIPVVVYGDASQLPDFDTVWSDHESGSYGITRSLIERDFTRILPYWPSRPGHPQTGIWLRQRQAGYLRAVEEAGIEPKTPCELRGLRINMLSRERFEQTARQIAGHLVEYMTGDQPVNAIVNLTDGIAMAVLKACRYFNLEPNTDVAVAGYDNYWLQSPLRQWETGCPMITADKRNFHIGHEMMDLLLKQVDNPKELEPEHRTVLPEIVYVNCSCLDMRVEIQNSAY